MIVENETLRYVIYCIVILLSLIISKLLFPYTLSPLTRFVNSPIAIFGMLISYVFTISYFSFLFVQGVIDPKKEITLHSTADKEIIEKYNQLSNELERKGITKLSEKIVFFEKNEKPLVIEVVFQNKSEEKIKFGYVIQFLNPDKTVFDTTATDVISLEPNEIYAYSLISPSNISGLNFIEKKLSIKGLFIEIN